ncbi:MAG: lipopolysaccharide biosynthesis protein [Patescibacteria group bacterium]
MLRKSILKISIVSGGNVFNAVLGFTFLTAVAKNLAVEDFGKYALMTSLLVFLSKLMDLGTNSIFVAESIADTRKLKDTLFSLKIMQFIVAVPITLVLLKVFNLLDQNITWLFIVGLLAYGINLLLFAYFQRVEMFIHLVLINTIPAAIKGLFAVLVFVGIFNLTLTSAFAIFALSMLSCTVMYVLVPKELKQPRFVTTETLSLLSKSISGGAAQGIGFGWSAIGNGLAKLFKTFTDVGIYSLADKIANIFTLVALGIFTVLLPKQAKQKRSNNEYNWRETLLLGMGVLILAIFAMFSAEFFVEIVFGSKFAESKKLLDILIIASAITAIHTFMESYYFIEKNTMPLLIITLVKLFALIAGSYLLIPLYELPGLAVAQLIAALGALLISGSYIYFKTEQAKKHLI